MTGQGDWVIGGQNLTAPPFLNPDDAGFVLGTDVPPCMQAVYAAVFRLKSNGAATGGLNASPQWFIGERIIASTVDFGWLIYDGDTVCGYRVVWTWQGTNRNDNLGTITDTMNMGGISVASGLPAFFSSTLNIGQTSGAGNAPVYALNLNKGDALVSTFPDPAKMPLTLDQVSMPRGTRSYVENTVAVPAGAAGVEILGLVANPFTRWTNRAYRIKAYGFVTHSVVGDVDVHIHQGNILAGAIVKFARFPMGNAVPEYFQLDVVLKHTAASVAASQICIGIQSISGGTVSLGAGPTGQPALEIIDVGDTTMYASAEAF